MHCNFIQNYKKALDDIQPAFKDKKQYLVRIVQKYFLETKFIHAKNGKK